MKIFDKIREWASRSDEERVQLDRRAFLKGMAVTSAGLLVPGAAVFDLGRSLHVDGNFNAFEPDALWGAVDDFMRGEPRVVGRIQIAGPSHFVVGDKIRISGTGPNDGSYYVVSAVTGSDLCIAEAIR